MRASSAAGLAVPAGRGEDARIYAVAFDNDDGSLARSVLLASGHVDADCVPRWTGAEP